MRHAKPAAGEACPATHTETPATDTRKKQLEWTTMVLSVEVLSYDLGRLLRPPPARRELRNAGILIKTSGLNRSLLG